MKKVLLTISFLLILCTSIFAKYTQTCQVKYSTTNGWSKKYTVEVNFLTGSELNTATNSFNYSSYSTYAAIFWGEGKATIIKLSSYLSCGMEVSKSCITSSIMDLKGKDQEGDEWNICTGNYCY
jgi:hypothetical protein